MIIFFTIGLAGLVWVILTSALGHDHDTDHEVAVHDFGHDADTTNGETTSEAGGHITSIFSTKIIATFMMGFGGAGGIARFYDWNYAWSSLTGIGAGLVVAYLVFKLLDFFAKQQCNSLFATSNLVGSIGTVTVAIIGNDPGEVSVSYSGRYGAFTARSQGGETFGTGSKVKIVETVGSDLLVAQA